MKGVYLDTSVFFKIFFDESGKEVVDRIVSITQEKKIQIIISEWVVNEAIAAVEKKVSKGKIQNVDAHDTLVAITTFLEENYSTRDIVSYSINEKVVLTSRAAIEYLRINASDALHVLVAATSECKYFISADKELNDRIKAGGLYIIPIDIHDKNDVREFFAHVDP